VSVSRKYGYRRMMALLLVIYVTSVYAEYNLNSFEILAENVKAETEDPRFAQSTRKVRYRATYAMLKIWTCIGNRRALYEPAQCDEFGRRQGFQICGRADIIYFHVNVKRSEAYSRIKVKQQTHPGVLTNMRAIAVCPSISLYFH